MTEELVEDLMEDGETGILDNDPLEELFEAPAEETVIEEAVTTPEADETGIKTDETVVPAEEPKTEVKVESAQDEGWKNAYFAEKKRREKAEVSTAKPVEPTAFDWTNPEKTIETIKSDLRQENQTNFLNMSQAQAEARHDDFTEKYTVFSAMAQENPAIVQTMLSKPDPAQYAYDLAKSKMFQDEVGADPVAFREKIAAEERAKLEIEFNTNAGKKNALAASLPPSASSLADNVPHAGVQKDPIESLFPGQVAS